MTATEIISWKDKILFPIRNHTDCCCIPCCGLPTNCTISLTVNGVTYTYSHATQKWMNGAEELTVVLPSFGNCYDPAFNLDKEYYKSCCLSVGHGDAPYLPEPGCSRWIENLATRIVCDECCAETPIRALGCRLEYTQTFIFMEGDCTAALPNMSFSMVCTEEPCNPLP